MKKLPPIEKIYEAYSAVADGRVTLREDHALVRSSNRAKEYKVSWGERTYSSNDNATHWQGYAGYPVIAVLMLQGKLPLNRDVAALFAGINWTEANAEAKRDYAKAVETVLARLGIDDGKQAEARAEAVRAFEALQALDIEIKRSSSRASRGSA